MKKIYKKKRRARKILLQILYSLYFYNFNFKAIDLTCTVIEKFNKNKVDFYYLSFMLNIILKKNKILDFLIDYNFNNYKYFNLLDKFIVKIAICDIFFNDFTSFKIIISEAIELSKLFGSKSSYIIVNSLLNDFFIGYIFNNKFI